MARALVKPSIPADALERSVDTGDLREKAASNPFVVSRRLIGKQPRKPAPKEERLLGAAVEAAKELIAVEKMKLCYKSKEDEWWVSIYVDIGNRIDVRQFIWNRELEKLEPFLVLKRISKSKLPSELDKAESGSICEVVTLRLPTQR